MSLLILFDPEYITINSIPYALDPDEKASQPLTLGKPSRSWGIWRPHGRKSTKVSQAQATRQNTYDGTAESEDSSPRIASSANTTSEQPAIPLAPRVQFQSSLLQSATQNATLRAGTSFNDPFTGEEAGIRRTSGSSDASDLVRPSAFLHHRDTLDRLYASTEEEEDDETTQEVFFRRPQLYSHRDTLARLHFSQNSDVALPDNVLLLIAGFLDQEEYHCMRLVCRWWTEHLPRPKLAASQQLPHELIVQILAHLLLPDFDAARHTCRSWFVASLDPKIAAPVLRAYGSRSAYLQDLQNERQRRSEIGRQPNLIGPTTNSDDSNQIDEPWLISKRLATESRVSGH